MVNLKNGSASLDVTQTGVVQGSVLLVSDPATPGNIFEPYGQLDYDQGEMVTLAWELIHDATALNPVQEVRIRLVNAEDVTETFMVRDWAGATNDVVLSTTFTMPSKAGTWLIEIGMRRTSATSWEASNIAGVVSGAVTILDRNVGRVRARLEITSISASLSGGGTPSLYAAGDTIRFGFTQTACMQGNPGLAWKQRSASVSPTITRTKTIALATAAGASYIEASIGDRSRSLSSGNNDTSPDLDFTLHVESIPDSDCFTSYSFQTHADFGAVENSGAWTVLKSTTDGYTGAFTLEKVDLFTANGTIGFSDDGVTLNHRCAVKTQPRVLRLFNRSESLGVAGTEVFVYVLNARGEQITTTLVSGGFVAFYDPGGTKNGGDLSFTQTGARWDLTHTVGSGEYSVDSTTETGPEHSLRMYGCVPWAADGWSPENTTSSPGAQIRTAPGGGYYVTDKLAVDFDARASRTFGAFDPSTRKRKFTIAGQPGYVLPRVRTCQHVALGGEALVVRAFDPFGVLRQEDNVTSDVDGYGDADLSTAGLQGTLMTVTTPADVWTWTASCSDGLGNSGSDSQAVVYVSPFTGDVVAVLQFPLKHEPGARLRVWASYGRLDDDTGDILWAGGSDITLDEAPSYRIYQFSPSGPRESVVDKTTMTPHSDPADYYFDYTPLQRRTYLIVAWATLDGQLVTSHAAVRVEPDGTVLNSEVSSDRARGIRYVGQQGVEERDVDEIVVTDKTMASREAATGSAEAVLDELSSDEAEFTVTRLDDDNPYEVGDTLSIPSLGVEGTIVNVERKGRDVQLTLGREPYQVGRSDTQTRARLEKEERA